ncbi:transposase [Dokdonella soli]|uniref:transposase n=1 Tax=Dokdonella soli TaxID=529810 RepID=UPI0031DAEFD4
MQRGNNRMPCFFDDDDRRRYMTVLREASLRHHCSIHAYVLMSNHVHLLASPATPGATASMMQSLGRMYVSTFNARHRRSGTLWEGRYKSRLVDSEAYLLRCYRYIELNPVRAAMVAAPEDYRWSSYNANAAGADDPLIHPHPSYTALGATPDERQRLYRQLVSETLSEDELAEIRIYVQQQRALGSNRFQAMIEAELGRCAHARPAHRPRLAQPADDTRG